jgi:uncharacterized protein (DUF58 family)
MAARAWTTLALLLIPLALLFNSPPLLLIAALLLATLPLAWLWNRHSLRALVYHRRLGQRRAFPGEVIELSLQLTNDKILPLNWLLLEDEWSLALPLLDAALLPSTSGHRGLYRTAFSIRWFERITRQHQLRCTRRGFYPLGPAQLQSGDIFGLFRQHATQATLDWLIVYPQVLPLDALGFPLKEPFGDIKARWRLFEDPVRSTGIRDHQPGDSFRHIHWPATARRQELQTVVHEPTTSPHLVIFLNTTTFPQHWRGVDPLLLEQTVSVAASVARHGVEERHLVGLLANGTVPHADQPLKVLPSRRPDQLARLFEALAAVTSFATCGLDTLLLAESPRLPWGATLVIVTALVTDNLRAALLRLKEAGRRLALVSVEGATSLPFDPLPGVLTYHLPASELPFDPDLMGEPIPWAPEYTPPLRFTGTADAD